MEAKKLKCMTHGHGLRGDADGSRGAGWRGIKGRKWDSCNSIIIKYIKNKNRYVMHRREAKL